jgi:hypothetical protein
MGIPIHFLNGIIGPYSGGGDTPDSLDPTSHDETCHPNSPRIAQKACFTPFSMQ